MILQDWLPSVLTGLLTGALAIAGVWFTQRSTWRREEAARDWDQRKWERDQRRSAHMEFLNEQRALQKSMWRWEFEYGGLDENGPVQENWAESLADRLTEVEIFGSRESATAAEKVLTATLRLEEGTSEDFQAANAAVEEYRRAVQADLGIRPTDLSELDR